MSARGWRKGGPVPDATPQDPLEPPLPAKFIELRAFPDEKVQPGKFVNIIGLVKDWRCPVPTCRGEFKRCSVKVPVTLWLMLQLG
jgi:hypothetical protein